MHKFLLSIILLTMVVGVALGTVLLGKTFGEGAARCHALPDHVYLARDNACVVGRRM